ncbi:DNA/RNA non-specific endonuclease [Staphylococcus epidermidis]|nr:DNA/RNA non-specific endonuclease [Staphylococcus epidermidis]MBF2232302.1 DNA/RNA non-specific endonuclease [Staphylococcus epidermidis]MBG3871715.1 DNA/RNA non-specific endonuclease [Staphylococcus epidermidis]MDH8742433.1 DNA/RNA non-specific endonuclease [Staphylococcus epidermidis]MDH8749314.1 DNA/RNA non-specific endonuclease [Staphylococcus epidermidis]MDH8819669.1 DNA/RNA non-specific endonuclease [Staphylococcus epidermidis]
MEYATPHGHVYRTDHKGRIKEVYAYDLSLQDGGRNSYAQRTVGRKDRLPDDDGGHLIVRTFGGSKDIDNLVPQSKYINRSFKENGQWYNMEREWRETLDKGGTIKSIKIKILYPQDSTRASVFKVTYQKKVYQIKCM